MTNDEGEKPDMVTAEGTGYFFKYTESTQRADAQLELQMAHYVFGAMARKGMVTMVGEPDPNQPTHWTAQNWREPGWLADMLTSIREMFRSRAIAETQTNYTLRRLGGMASSPALESMWVRRLIEGSAEQKMFGEALAMVREMKQQGRLSRRERAASRRNQDRAGAVDAVAAEDLSRLTGTPLAESVRKLGELGMEFEVAAQYGDAGLKRAASAAQEIHERGRAMRKQWAADVLKEINRVAPKLTQFRLNQPLAEVSVEEAEALVNRFYKNYPGLTNYIRISKTPDVHAWAEVRLGGPIRDLPKPKWLEDTGHKCDEVHPGLTHLMWKSDTFVTRYAETYLAEGEASPVPPSFKLTGTHTAPVSDTFAPVECLGCIGCGGPDCIERKTDEDPS